MQSNVYEREAVVRVLFLRKIVVEVTIHHGFTTLDEIIQSVIKSEKLADLKQEMSIYHQKAYLPSLVQPPLTLHDIATTPIHELLLQGPRQVRRLARCSPLATTRRWPLQYKVNEVGFLIDVPDTIASLLSKARAESRSTINFQEFYSSNELGTFCGENSYQLLGTRWDRSRPLVQAQVDTGAPRPIIRVVIKYSSSPTEPDIWTRIRSLCSGSRTQHLGVLFCNPIPVLGTDSGVILAMYDHGNNLLDYSPYPGPATPKIWVQQLCSAVCFLHNNRIVHRDIKPDNITINWQTQDLTLVDFSTAAFVKEGDSFKMEGGVGTHPWVHTLVKTKTVGESYDARRMDIWAVGKVLVSFLSKMEYMDEQSAILVKSFGIWLMDVQLSDGARLLQKLEDMSSTQTPTWNPERLRTQIFFN